MIAAANQISRIVVNLVSYKLSYIIIIIIVIPHIILILDWSKFILDSVYTKQNVHIYPTLFYPR
jgi:hypothetical protein